MVRQGLPTEYADVGVLYEDDYILLLRDAARFPDGRLGSFIRIVPARPDGAVILPIADSRILLLRHFRHATRRWHWEAPRGFGEPGEEPDQTARRELNEECSLAVEALHDLGRVTTDAGISSTWVHLFAADATGTMSLDSAEAISAARWLTIPDIESWIRDERIDDALTICAVARARARGLI
jgi:ADP-ribose pyrophosphatase